MPRVNDDRTVTSLPGDPIAYTANADYLCAQCAYNAYGAATSGYYTHIALNATDSGGNMVGAVFGWEEWWSGTGEAETLACGTCGTVLARYAPLASVPVAWCPRCGSRECGGECETPSLGAACANCGVFGCSGPGPCGDCQCGCGDEGFDDDPDPDGRYCDPCDEYHAYGEPCPRASSHGSRCGCYDCSCQCDDCIAALAYIPGTDV